jgi:RimJ/RimL family protein N-acetyltransferase
MKKSVLIQIIRECIKESNENEIDEKRFIVDKTKHKFQLFLGDILVTESGFNIVSPDKWFKQKYVIIHDLKTFKYFQKGQAQYLLERIFEYVKNELKLNIIALIVYKNNYLAMNLYFKSGFEIFMEYDDSYSLIKKLF